MTQETSDEPTEPTEPAPAVPAGFVVLVTVPPPRRISVETLQGWIAEDEAAMDQFLNRR